MDGMFLNNPDPKDLYWPAADLYKTVTGKEANRKIVKVTDVDCALFNSPSGEQLRYITPPLIQIYFDKNDISDHSIQALITTLISAIPVDMSNFFSGRPIKVPFEFTNRMLKSMIVTGTFHFSDSGFIMNIRFNSRLVGITLPTEEAAKMANSMIDIMHLYLANAAAKYKEVEKSLNYSVCRFDLITKNFNDAMDVFKKFLIEEDKR